MMLDRLKTTDIERVRSLLLAAENEQSGINYLDDFMKQMAEDVDNGKPRVLTENELHQLCLNNNVKRNMILLFLIDNISLEYLRKKEGGFEGNSVLVKDIWSSIKGTLYNKLLLSRDMNSYYGNNGGEEQLNKFMSLSKRVEIKDLVSEIFFSVNTLYFLSVNGRYELEVRNGDVRNFKEEFNFVDRKTCCHVGLYDPFNFGEPQTFVARRYMNNCRTQKRIMLIFTVYFMAPQLTVLLLDGTFIKVNEENIASFLGRELGSGEIDKNIYDAIKNDNPYLFLESLNNKIIETVFCHLESLIKGATMKSMEKGRPILIILAETPYSKHSFFLQIVVLILAARKGIKHLIAETINLYHYKNGWDAPVQPLIRLLSFSKEFLSMNLMDLERSLHYKGKSAGYPYHHIPENTLSHAVRENSWIIDIKASPKDSVFILGAAHLTAILKSELKNVYEILPINLTCNKVYSEKASIMGQNFVELDCDLSGMTLDKLIDAAQSHHLKNSSG